MHYWKKKAEGEAIGVAKGEVNTKKEILISLMQEFPELSDAKLSKLAKVDEAFVRDLRKEMMNNKK